MTALSFLQSLVEPNQIKLRAIHASFSDQQYQSAQIPLSTFHILQFTALLFLSLVEVLWIFWAGLCSGIESTRAGPIQRQLFDAWTSSQTCFCKGKDIGDWAFFPPQQWAHHQKQLTTARNILSEETSLQIPISPSKASRWRKASAFLRIWNIYAYQSPSKLWCPLL